LLTRVASEFVSLAFLEVFSYTGSTGGGLPIKMQGNMSFSERNIYEAVYIQSILTSF